MAEALAVISIVANIIQLIDFSLKVLHRLDEFQSSLGEVPKAFRHFSSELPVLKVTLQKIIDTIEAGSAGDETEKALLPALHGCKGQIQLLDTLLASVLPEATDSRLKRSKKAVLSLTQEAKVESITKILHSYIRTLTFYYTVISSTRQTVTDEKLTKIRKWLSPPDPSPNYQKAAKQRQPDTGLWFLEGQDYAAWKANPASFIWLYGIPGCGKTILSSSILQDILEYCANDPGKVVAYFYFDFKDTEKQSPELMIRSLVFQLSQQCIKIPTTLEALFSSCAHGQRQPSLDSLLEVMSAIIQEFPESYIVLDALDECADRTELMSVLERIIGLKLEGSHLLVTSRKERDIETALETVVDSQNIICLQSKLVDRDIRAYVQQRLSDDRSLNKWHKDPDIRHEIDIALTEKANGMFRWAVCQLDALGKCRNRSTLRKALTSLPSTLDETYDRILCSISEEDSEYAVRILRWLAFSARPLLVEEIAEVIAIDTERKPAFNREEVLEDTLDVLSICSSLVTITTTTEPTGYEIQIELSTPSTLVVLAHYSVKEYLISGRSTQSVASRYAIEAIACHEFLAKSCIGYLLQFQLPDSISKGNIHKSKLVPYAVEFWIKHAQAGSHDGEDLNCLIMELFSTGNGAYLNWARLYDAFRPWNQGDFKKVLTEVPAPLYYASSSGLTTIVKLLLKKGADVNAQGGHYGNALQAAAANGHEQIVILLLEKGADVNAQGGYDGNALQAAAGSGHEQIVILLLEKGADINAQGGHHGNALQAAAANGHEQIVKLLLKNGADINARGGIYGNALQAAVASYHEQIVIVKLLLEKGADINAQGGQHGNALQAAATNGHIQTVKLLLEKGADINARGGIYGNALQAAATKGHIQTVKLLLSIDAIEADSKDHQGRTPLFWATRHGSETVVKLLLDTGKVDADSKDKKGLSPLFWAMRNGHEAVIKLLLDTGKIDTDSKDYQGRTPLFWAIENRREAVIKLLLDVGKIDADSKNDNGQTPLSWAAENGDGTIAKVLLQAGCQVEIENGAGWTPLQLAVLNGHTEVEQLLKNWGASEPEDFYGLQHLFR